MKDNNQAPVAESSNRRALNESAKATSPAPAQSAPGNGDAAPQPASIQAAPPEPRERRSPGLSWPVGESEFNWPQICAVKIGPRDAASLLAFVITKHRGLFREASRAAKAKGNTKLSLEIAHCVALANEAVRHTMLRGMLMHERADEGFYLPAPGLAGLMLWTWRNVGSELAALLRPAEDEWYPGLQYSRERWQVIEGIAASIESAAERAEFNEAIMLTEYVCEIEGIGSELESVDGDWQSPTKIQRRAWQSLADTLAL